MASIWVTIGTGVTIWVSIVTAVSMGVYTSKMAVTIGWLSFGFRCGFRCGFRFSFSISRSLVENMASIWVTIGTGVTIWVSIVTAVSMGVYTSKMAVTICWLSFGFRCGFGFGFSISRSLVETMAISVGPGV